MFVFSICNGFPLRVAVRAVMNTMCFGFCSSPVTDLLPDCVHLFVCRSAYTPVVSRCKVFEHCKFLSLSPSLVFLVKIHVSRIIFFDRIPACAHTVHDYGHTCHYSDCLCFEVLYAIPVRLKHLISTDKTLYHLIHKTVFITTAHIQYICKSTYW